MLSSARLWQVLSPANNLSPIVFRLVRTTTDSVKKQNSPLAGVITCQQLIANCISIGEDNNR
ncbi:MAG TPA: hypothetical protein PK301_02140 [Chitinophagales bacterium]|nr:hypothetical protein [Chitinophagales bacterium]